MIINFTRTGGLSTCVDGEYVTIGFTYYMTLYILGHKSHNWTDIILQTGQTFLAPIQGILQDCTNQSSIPGQQGCVIITASQVDVYFIFIWFFFRAILNVILMIDSQYIIRLLVEENIALITG